MPTYFVTIKAFGRISATKVEAPDEQTAIRTAKDAVGYSIEVAPYATEQEWEPKMVPVEKPDLDDYSGFAR